MAANSTPFRVSEAIAQGLSPGVLRSRAFEAPFHGIRARSGTLFDIDRICGAYLCKMPPGSVFAGVTAARLWGFPLPAYLPSDISTVDVAAPAPRRAPRGAHVRGSQFQPEIVSITGLRGLPVLTAVDAWCSLARVLDLADLTAVADHLLSDGPTSPLGRSPFAALSEAVDRRSGHRGSVELRAALGQARPHCWSRTETLTRLVLCSAGIPEPVLNHLVWIRGRQFRLDLAWPAVRFGLEYDGDHHRNPRQFVNDIGRHELIQDENWALMRMTRLELFDSPEQLVRRVAGRLADRGLPAAALQVSRMVQPRR
ncbi:MAG: hypothetical protein ABIO06_04240 [Pseudolysinimonas sp.]